MEPEIKKPKQVILVRTDLDMDIGKMGSQIAHAAMKVFFDRSSTTRNEDRSGVMTTPMTAPMMDWHEGEFTKVLLEVTSEKQLRKKHQQALDSGLPTAFIIDNGHTVFDGVKTPTTCAIGPADPDEIDQITGRLPLLRLRKDGVLLGQALALTGTISSGATGRERLVALLSQIELHGLEKTASIYGFVVSEIPQLRRDIVQARALYDRDPAAGTTSKLWP